MSATPPASLSPTMKTISPGPDDHRPARAACRRQVRRVAVLLLVDGAEGTLDVAEVSAS